MRTRLFLTAITATALTWAALEPGLASDPRFYPDDPIVRDPETQNASGVQEIDISEGNIWAPEWVDLGRQFVERVAARAQPPHATAEGREETARHLAREGLPILTHLEAAPVDGGMIRPLVAPRPLYPWSIVHRRASRLAGIVALNDAATALAGSEGWLDRPSRSWLPEPEATQLRDGSPRAGA